MDLYAYLLSGLGFNLHSTSYFLVCNAKRDQDGFNQIMRFDEYLVPYKWNSDWIDEKLDNMLAIINQKEIPEANESCKNSAYSDQYAKKVHSVDSNQREITQGALLYLKVILFFQIILISCLTKE